MQAKNLRSTLLMTFIYALHEFQIDAGHKNNNNSSNNKGKDKDKDIGDS